LPRPDFRTTAARRLAEEGELAPSVISFLSDSPSRAKGVRNVPLDRIEANPDQPRLAIDQDALNELTASIREHGVLQPVLVRPLGTGRGGRFQLIAGERRWRAARQAGLPTIPALIEEIDDDTALEIAIIENLQREDLSPLDEALMYERMTRDHGYSVRKLAQKIGKDKGYVENRLRLADAPPEVKELVSLRKDTISHAYELLKVEDPKKRRKLAEQVASGELSLMKLRDRIEGRGARGRRRLGDAAEAVPPPRGYPGPTEPEPEPEQPEQPERYSRDEDSEQATEAWTGQQRPRVINEDSLLSAKGHLAEAIDELVEVLRSSDASEGIALVDRNNLAKYLTIAKLRLENAIALVRSGQGGEPGSR
jgi:ParB family transcriptional regulator, chromosome partitioning protein